MNIICKLTVPSQVCNTYQYTLEILACQDPYQAKGSANRFPCFLPTYLPKKRSETCLGNGLITPCFRRAVQTPWRQWQFHTAINGPTVVPHSLRLRDQSFSHLTVISGFSFVPNASSGPRTPSLFSRGELSILLWQACWPSQSPAVFSLLFHFVPVTQVRLSHLLDIRSCWKIRDSSFLLVCSRYRNLTHTNPTACH